LRLERPGVAVFEKWKAKRSAAKAAADQERAVAAARAARASWQSERDEHAEELQIAREFRGVRESSRLMLHRDEAVFLEVENAALIEPRRGAGEWKGRSQGVSVPIGSLGGRSIRYHVGATKGHYVQGAEEPTVVDTGVMIITNTRVVFAGAKQTRECLFAKLVSYDHLADATIFSVSNRQKATSIGYGVQVAPEVRFRLELAIAVYRNDIQSLIHQLEEDLAQIDGRAPVAVDTSPAAMPDRADWYPDPSRRHELRYFDGRNWTDHVSDHGAQSTDPFSTVS
jgi:hypothetical protein